MSDLAVGVLLAVLGLPLACAAQSYPVKPVRLVVPAATGGTSDLSARVISQRLGEQMGQTFVVDNRPGAANNLGAEVVARAPADGYTLLLADTTLAINPSLYAKLGYDIEKDLAPVSGVIRSAFVLVVNPGVGAATVSDLIRLARSAPGKLNYGSGGVGTGPHLVAHVFASMAGVSLTHVPYKGAGPAVTDLIGGQIQILMAAMPTALGHVRSGKLRALAVSDDVRFPGLPEVPTVAEAGLPGYAYSAWFGLMAPANTPREILDRLSSEVARGLSNPETRDRFVLAGGVPAGSTPEEFRRFLSSEIVKWGRVVRDSGAKVE